MADDKFRKPLPDDLQWVYTRWVLAQKFPGLTPEYFDELSYAKRTSLFAVLEAQHKAEKILRDRAERKNKRGSGRWRRR